MSNKKYDLAVCYRVYPGISKIPPVFSNNKLKLTEYCLRSFIESTSQLNIKMYVILDGCPKEYDILFKKYFSQENLEIIHTNKIGNGETFLLQMKTLLDQDDSDYIYFAEDDYFYFPSAFNEMLDLMKTNADADFLSPYDHPDYNNLGIHKLKNKKNLMSSRNWNTVATTCMTFLTTKTSLRLTQSAFLKYNKSIFDTGVWLSITKIGILNPIHWLKLLITDRASLKTYIKTIIELNFKIIFTPKIHLLTPKPTLAVHLESGFLPNGFNWDKEFQTKIYYKEIFNS